MNHAVRKKLVKPSQSSGSSITVEEMNQLKVGTRVSHDRFGKGEITGLEGEIPNRKATVEFQNIGKKQLLLKFAKLQILK